MIWCERLVIPEGGASDVRVQVDAHGMIQHIESGVPPQNGDDVYGTVLPGIANAHSHAFHRLLRGRSHAPTGDFWTWRRMMYDAASRLEPASYEALARAVFAEMLSAGYTAVGEFHYVHHRADGSAYPHEMELALVRAAESVGIRLTLLDTAYLAGGIGLPLAAEQQRFGDGTAEGYLERWYALRERIPWLGAAIHSVRAVPPAAWARIAEGLPAEVPLHIHLSEQPLENTECLAEYGATPTRMLRDAGLLTSRLSAVHATHLSGADLDDLGGAGVGIVMCPTTEADLGDGIGPARALRDAGAVLAIGSDQHAVIDAFVELRALEMHERLASGLRGRFTPGEVLDAGSAGGYRSLGWLTPPMREGGPCDFVEIDASSARTAGADAEQLIFAATSADVRTVVVGGRQRYAQGALADGGEPGRLLREALEVLS